MDETPLQCISKFPGSYVMKKSVVVIGSNDKRQHTVCPISTHSGKVLSKRNQG